MIRQNDEDADGMFFVESGSVRVTLTNDNFDTETEVRNLLPWIIYLFTNLIQLCVCLFVCMYVHSCICVRIYVCEFVFVYVE